MADQVLIYISAAADLAGEREILGRLVTEIPVDLAWRINQSPRHSEPVDLEAVQTSDIHFLLLGGDIRAPVGQEWFVARRSGRQPVLFLKEGVNRTQAAEGFVRYVESYDSWRLFKDGARLRHEVLKLLSDHIIERALYYALSPLQLQALKAWRAELDKKIAAVDEDTRGGAGESSLILSRERFKPSQGILIEPDKLEMPGDE